MNEFISSVSDQFRQLNYVIDYGTNPGGVHGLLYVHSQGFLPLGFAKVEDHFLFIDWDHATYGRLDKVKEIYKQFSSQVNQGFKVPHALRTKIPNLVVIAVSEDQFPQEATAFSQSTILNPWYGGEVGQIILVDIGNRNITSLVSLQNGRYPKPGALALGHAAGIIRKVCGQAFADR